MFCGVSWKFRHGCDIQDSVRQHCYSEILLEWLNRITETFAGNLLTQLCTYKRITGARYTIEQNFYWTPSIMEVVREHQYQGPQCSIPWWTFASKRGCRTYQASCCLGAGRAVPWDKAARCEADHSHQLPRLRYRYLYIFVYIYIYIFISLLTDMPWWSAQVQSYLLLYIIISSLTQQEPCLFRRSLLFWSLECRPYVYNETFVLLFIKRKFHKCSSMSTSFLTSSTKIFQPIYSFITQHML